VGSQVGGVNNQIPASIKRIDKDTGETIWSTPRSCPTSNGCLVAVANDKVYYFEAGGNGPIVTAADLATGTPLFSTASGQLEAGFVQQVGLFVNGDMVYVPRGQQGLPGEAPPGVEFDTFFALRDTGVSFEVIYGLPSGFVPFSTSGVASDGTVYAYRTPEDSNGDLVGELVVIRIDAGGNIIDQSAPLPTPTIAPSPRMAIGGDDTIYLTTGEILVSLNADLTENWRVTDAADVGAPALGQDGILVVNFTGTDIRAFQTAGCNPADLAAPFGVLDGADVNAFISAFGMAADEADLNGDGIVDGADVNAFISAFGAGCP
jgi:outer membrane protein assembly factor BamB